MHKPTLIAEIANAHAGSIDRLLNILTSLKTTSTSNVKFQIYSGRDICSANHKRRAHFENQSFSPIEWEKILDYAKQLEFTIHADIFGFEALDIALDNNLTSFKLHSSDTLNIPLIEAMVQTAETIFLSCGGTYIGEIIEAVEIIEKRCIPTCKIVFMHGYQSYPSPINTTALNRLQKLQKIFGKRYSYGYMDHVDGGSENSIYFPLLALPYNIDYIEKHVTINRSEKLTDYFSSIDIDKLDYFDDMITEYCEAFDHSPLKFSNEEQYYRESTKKQWHLSENQLKTSNTSKPTINMQRPSSQSDGQIYFSQVQMYKNIHGNLTPGSLITTEIIQNTVNIVVVARTSSSRLPGKAMLLLPTGEETVLFLLRRLLNGLKNKSIDYKLCLATSDDSSDDQLVEKIRSAGFKVYRGSTSDVLQRIICASSSLGDSRFTVRVTGDDLLIDTEYLDKLALHAIVNDYDYCENKGLPSGMEVEIFKNSCLAQIHRSAINRDETEYLTFFVRDNHDLFHIGSYSDIFLSSKNELLKGLRLTVDYPSDFHRVCSIINSFQHKSPYGINIRDIISLVETDAKLFQIDHKFVAKGLEINTSLDIEKLRHNPLVTIFIVSHNYGAYAENAIKSILSQSFSQYSLVLVNNNSTDDTSDVFDQYSNVQGISIVELKSGHLHDANNYVLNNCRTKYIIRLDADDELEKHALQVMVEELERSSNKSYCTCDYYLMNKDRIVYGQEYRINPLNRSVKDIAPHGACTLFKVDHVRRQGGYSSNVTCQDGFDMLLKLNQEGGGTHVNLPLFRYRKHSNSLSSSPIRLQKARSELLRRHVGTELDVRDWSVIFLRDTESSSLVDLLNSCSEDYSTRLVRVLKSIFEERVILSLESTVSPELAQMLRSHLSVTVHLRKEHLSLPSSPIEDSILETIKMIDNPYTLTIASLCYPLIEEHSIRSCVNSIRAFQVDRSMTVLKRQNNHFKVTKDGIQPITPIRSLKDERDVFFEEAGGVHTVLSASFLECPSLYVGKATPIEISEPEALRNDSQLFGLFKAQLF